MRALRPALSFVLVLTALSLGCSPLARWQLKAARQFEQRGKMQVARRLYQGALKRLPEVDQQGRSRAYYRIGECLLSLGQPGEAFENFQRAVDLDPSNIKARLRLGELLLAGGALDRATDEALAALQAGDSDPDALALLGAASAGAGRNHIAELAFKKVLELEPGRVNVAISLADIYNREDRVEDARALLKKSAESQPGSALPLLALGRLEEQEGNVPGAEQAYREAVRREDTPQTNLRLAQFLERASRVDEAEGVLRRVDGMQPALPTALPDFELLAGKAGNALEQYLIAMRPGPSQHSPREPALPVAGNRAALAARIIEADLATAQADSDSATAAAIARLHLGLYRNELDVATIAMLQTEIALIEGDVTAAESQGEAAVKLAPDSAASQYVYGMAKHQAGDTTAARGAWLQAIEQDSGFVPARLALAQEALRAGDNGGAEEYVLPVVRDEPANLRALDLYARVLLAQKRLRAAALIANRAASVDDHAATPHVLLAAIAERRRRYAEALLQFERAVMLDSRSQEAMQGLVRIYRHGTITRPMLANMEKLAVQPPQSVPLMEITGRLYAEHRWYADAERCLRRTLLMDPQRSSAAAFLARVFAEHGDLEAATASAAEAGGKTAELFSGVTAQQRNDITEAIARYESALRKGERSGVAANNLAWLYAQQGTRLDRALTLAEKARALAPKNPAVLDTVGVVHLRRREYTEAIIVLKDAAALSAMPAFSRQAELAAEIRRHLSEAYRRAGMPEEGNKQ